MSNHGSPNGKHGSPGKKRALPIQQKHLVYNEWGAIIQHQDEMDRAMKAQDAARSKNHRTVYRADLENQRAAADRRKLEEKLEDQRQANNSVLYQQ